MTSNTFLLGFWAGITAAAAPLLFALWRSRVRSIRLGHETYRVAFQRGREYQSLNPAKNPYGEAIERKTEP